VDSISSIDEALASVRESVRSQRSHDPRTVIVSSGRYFSDGDAVEVLVRTSDDGLRVVVSDGGMTMARRSLYGIESFAKTADNMWKEILADFGVESFADRVFHRGPVQMMPHLIGLVADTCIALDSVRLLSENVRSSFTEKLESWLARDSGVKVTGERVVHDLHGEGQKVTAIVESPRGELLVQGAGGRSAGNLKQSAEHAYFLFSGLDSEEWRHESRLIVLEHLPARTDQQRRAAKSLVARLTEQAYVGTFEAQISLNRFLVTKSPPSERDLATITYGQSAAD
jgi:hypothetical protein